MTLDDYCFKCGCWTQIDELSKLCRRCYDSWPDNNPAAGTGRGDG